MTALPGLFRDIPIAHRALHDVAEGRPENSRAAIRGAMDAGYGIEIDLQLSRDGQAMVFHDYDLGRLTAQSGPVQQRDAADLEGIGLIGGAEGIPRLDEILTLVAGRAPLLIELKDQHGQMGETDGRLETAVARALAGYDGPAAVMSFNPHMIATMAELAPDTPRGIVSCGYTAEDWPLLKPGIRDMLRDIPDYARASCSFISHHHVDLDRPRVAELASEGGTILCWTVRSPGEEAAARRHAHNVTFEGYLPGAGA